MTTNNKITDRVTILAEASTTTGNVQVVRRFRGKPIDSIYVPDAHHFELVHPFNRASACFHDRWQRDRFERMGNLFFVPVRETLRIKSECEQQNSIVFQIRPEAVDQGLDGSPSWSDAKLRAALAIPNEQIRSNFLRLESELLNPGFEHAWMLNCLTGQIVVQLVRYFIDIGKHRARRGLSVTQQKRIDERIAAPELPPSRTELAELCGLSIRQLARAFRLSHDCTIVDYLVNRGIIRARGLLASDVPIKWIAHSMGFSSSSNFTAAFRRVTGETPRSYRTRIRQSAHPFKIRMTRTHPYRQQLAQDQE